MQSDSQRILLNYETFNETLKEMMESGELDEIIAEHLSEEFIVD